MIRSAAAQRQGSARAGRWCSRALLVVGGALAGTAAAFALSAASASASPEAHAPGSTAGSTAASTATSPSVVSVTPVTDAGAKGANDLTWGVARLAGGTTEALSHAGGRLSGKPGDTGGPARDQEPGSPLPRHGKHRTLGGETDGTAERVSKAVHDFAEEAVLRPVGRTVGALEHIVRKPQDTRQVIGDTLAKPPVVHDLGSALDHLLHSGVVTLPGQPGPVKSPPIYEHGTPIKATPASAPAAPPATTADNRSSELAPVTVIGGRRPAAAGSRTDVFGLTARGAPAVGEQHAPAVPAQLPFVPPTAPAAPSGGSGSGAHLDGLLSGLTAGPLAAFDSTVSGSLRRGHRFLPVRPGEAPGITPD